LFGPLIASQVRQYLYTLETLSLKPPSQFKASVSPKQIVKYHKQNAVLAGDAWFESQSI